MSYPYSTFNEDWSDETVWIVGGGSSLRDFDFSILTDELVVGTNRSAFTPGVDILFTIDQRFVREQRYDVARFIESGRRAYLAMPENDDTHDVIPGATYLRRLRGDDLSNDRNIIRGVHSGFGALNLVYLSGCKDIRLLGFDMNVSKAGAYHHHEEYPWQNKDTLSFYRRWAPTTTKALDMMESEGIQIANYVGSPGSALADRFSVPLECIA